jgi:hypothetical protein
MFGDEEVFGDVHYQVGFGVFLDLVVSLKFLDGLQSQIEERRKRCDGNSQTRSAGGGYDKGCCTYFFGRGGELLSVQHDPSIALLLLHDVDESIAPHRTSQIVKVSRKTFGVCEELWGLTIGCPSWRRSRHQ